MLRVTANWQGPITGLASSTFHFIGADPAGGTGAEATAAAAKVSDFFTTFRAILPTSESITVSSQIDVIDPATGQIVDSLNGGTQTPVVGEGTGGFSRAAGALVSWVTGIRVSGRLIRGRTFIVPTAGNAWGSDGFLADAATSRLGPAASALATPSLPRLVVYRRPTGGAGGLASPVTSFDVPIDGAVLRSRRD